MAAGKRIGVDLGGMSVKIGAVREDNQIVERVTLPMNRNKPFQEAVKEIAEAVLAMGAVASVGFGIPSTLIPGSQVIIHANNLGWKHCDIRKELKKYMGETPVYLANDADCAAVGELIHGAAKNVKSCLMLTLGTGIGGSYIHNGKLFLGGNGIGLEPGHMVIHDHGKPCSCGKIGCLETYASATSLMEEAERSNSPVLQRMISENQGRPNAKMVFDASAMNDPAANLILEEYIRHLAIGISNLIAVFGPERVVIGGGVSAAGDQLFIPLQKAVYKMVDEPELVGCPDIVPAILGNDAGIIGAAMLDKVMM